LRAGNTVQYQPISAFLDFTHIGDNGLKPVGKSVTISGGGGGIDGFWRLGWSGKPPVKAANTS